MIKGSIEERIEYEEYIRSLKDSIRYPFWPIYWESRKIIRYYWIKKAKEKRKFESKEIQILHLMSLVDTAVRVGGIVYAWFWEELLPNFITALPSSKAEWFVDVEDIAKTLMSIPTKTLETVLLKANAKHEVIRLSLKAHRQNDFAALTEQVGTIPLDDIFAVYKLVNSYHQLCESIDKMLKNETDENVTKYYLQDNLEVLETTFNSGVSLPPQQFAEQVTRWCQSLNLDDDDFINNTNWYIASLCALLECVHHVFTCELGESDPVPQTIREILDESSFQYIFNHYDLSKGGEHFLVLLKSFVHWTNKNFGANISIEELFDERDAKDSVIEQERANSREKSDNYYQRFYSLEAPDIEYEKMRMIACKLAGIEFKEKSISHSEKRYIDTKDVARFCYFFLGKICSPDNIAKVEFSYPILWLGDWKSLKYFIWKLYGKPKTLPSKMAEDVVEAFRINDLKRHRNKEDRCKISVKTFNNAKNIVNIIADEDRKRIDTILKEFEPFMKRQS